MAIRNNLLGGNDIQENEVEFKSADYNDTNNELVKHNVNNYRANILNTIRQLQDRTISFSADGGEWAEAYVDSTGRLNSVDSTTMQFDTNKYESITSSTEPFVIIEATSLTESDFSINDCFIGKVDTGKWLLRCTSGTDEVKRAQLLKTLFYGTDGSDPRASSSYITNLTDIKTTVDDDVGKRAHYIKLRANYPAESDNFGPVYFTGDFVNTTSNECFIWGYTYARRGVSGTAYSRLEIPTDNIIQQSSSSSAGVAVYHDNLGTETFYTVNNPANFRLSVKNRTNENRSGLNFIHAIIICDSDINNLNLDVALDLGPTSGFSTINTHTNFVVDNGINTFTSETEPFENIITHDIPSGTLPSTISTCVGSPLVADWETGADIQYKLTNANEDSGWLDVNKMESFTAFTSEPEQCVVKLIPKETDPTTGYPSIYGFGLIGDRT